MREPRLYFYKMIADNGGAPCIQDKQLSLAICKPMIRSTAKIGDIIFGFAGNSLYHDNVLIYVAVVTEKLCDGAYYTEKSYSNRPDCIYERPNKKTYTLKRNAAFHIQADDRRDIGIAPYFKRANVLISSDFRYFGDQKNPEYKSSYPAIAKSIKKLMKGHRVNHSIRLRNELLTLKNDTWATCNQNVTNLRVIRDNPGSCTPITEKSGSGCGVC